MNLKAKKCIIDQKFLYTEIFLEQYKAMLLKQHIGTSDVLFIEVVN